MPIDLVVSTPCVITYRDTMYTLLDISLWWIYLHSYQCWWNFHRTI